MSIFLLAAPSSLRAQTSSVGCTDYKGEFRLGNKQYCYPLTVNDHASRYLVLCEALESTCESLAFTAFQTGGLPFLLDKPSGWL